MIAWTPGLTLEEVEKQVILKALSFYKGNKTQTAQSLEISVRTLYEKLAKYKEDQQNGSNIHS